MAVVMMELQDFDVLLWPNNGMDHVQRGESLCDSVKRHNNFLLIPATVTSNRWLPIDRVDESRKPTQVYTPRKARYTQNIHLIHPKPATTVVIEKRRGNVNFSLRVTLIMKTAVCYCAVSCSAQFRPCFNLFVASSTITGLDFHLFLAYLGPVE